MLWILSIIPTSSINELSKDLNRWLSTIELFLRHVQIVNVDNASHTLSWTKVISPSLVDLAVNNILDLVAVSLGRESNFND